MQFAFLGDSVVTDALLVCLGGIQGFLGEFGHQFSVKMMTIEKLHTRMIGTKPSTPTLLTYFTHLLYSVAHLLYSVVVNLVNFTSCSQKWYRQ